MQKKTAPVLASLAAAMMFVCAPASATIVLVKTSMGNFEVNLFDQTTPATVNNFLAYVKNGSYQNTIFHRSVSGFVLQGGGFRFSGDNSAPFSAVAQLAPIVNEPKLSNLRGTIAMAKIGGNANSATNQWFINLADNSANLDLQNGGFTVFGQVTGTGMEIINSISALPNNLNSNYPEVPLRNYTAADGTAKTPVTANNLVTIESITVINAEVNTAAGLAPKANTLITSQPPSNGGGSSGGSLGWFSLLAAALLVWRRRAV